MVFQGLEGLRIWEANEPCKALLFELNSVCGDKLGRVCVWKQKRLGEPQLDQPNHC